MSPLVSLALAEGARNITCTIAANNASVVCEGMKFIEDHEHYLQPGTPQFYVNIAICIILILSAGVFSGLTLGLLSLDLNQLKVFMEAGEPSERKNAKRIQHLLKNHHLLLVTLLLANAGVNESLPLFLDDLVPEYVAIIISVTAVLLFGEVIPQALCSKHGLAIGAFFAPFVTLLTWAFFPLGYPLSKLLDWILGEHHSAFFRRAELGVLVDIHGSESDENEEPLTKDEILIIKGALELSGKCAMDAMQEMKAVYMLHTDRMYTSELADEILRKGHSRIPVYTDSRERLLHFILTKSLIHYRKDTNTRIADIKKRALMQLQHDEGLYQCLKKFTHGSSHIAVVHDENNKSIGILTLEDVIEELLKAEIVDETDQYVDVSRGIIRSTRRKFSLSRNAASIRTSINITMLDPDDAASDTTPLLTHSSGNRLTINQASSPQLQRHAMRNNANKKAKRVNFFDEDLREDASDADGGSVFG